MMYDFMDRKDLAEYHLKKEIEVVNNPNSQEALLKFYLDNNMESKALNIAMGILKNNPDKEQVKGLVKNLQQKTR